MAVHALRFAHAGKLRIDLPLSGVGALGQAARRIAEEAPAASWRRIVAACTESDVDFLLLTPRVAARQLIAADRRALLEGFRQLDELGIPVFWSTTDDEQLAPQLLDALPDNVTLLTETAPTASFVRNERIEAELQLGLSARGRRPTVYPVRPDTSEDLLRIGITEHRAAIESVSSADAQSPSSIGERPSPDQPENYVACWGGTRELTHNVGTTVWSDPGTPLGRSADEPAGGGINIVEWEAGSIREVLRVSTATVRWERCQQEISAETSREELLERLQFALLEREAAIGEQLWLIDWHLVGSGTEFERLQSPAAQRELETAIESVAGTGDRLQRVHRWELRPRGLNSGDAVAARLLKWLDEHAEQECASVRASVEAEVRQTCGRDVAVHGDTLRPAVLRELSERQLAGWLPTGARTTSAD